MKNNQNLICPYCHSKLIDDREIIICSECNMPHHKECWVENNGCTTFGCEGTIDIYQEYRLLDIDLADEDFTSQHSFIKNANTTFESFGINNFDLKQFILSEYWMIYNKSYFYAFIIASVKSVFLVTNITMYIIISVILHIVIGLFGKNLICNERKNKEANYTPISNITAPICLALFYIVLWLLMGK